MKSDTADEVEAEVEEGGKELAATKQFHKIIYLYERSA
jgi:hypothetical protein